MTGRAGVEAWKPGDASLHPDGISAAPIELAVSRAGLPGARGTVFCFNGAAAGRRFGA